MGFGIGWICLLNLSCLRIKGEYELGDKDKFEIILIFFGF